MEEEFGNTSCNPNRLDYPSGSYKIDVVQAQSSKVHSSPNKCDLVGNLPALCKTVEYTLNHLLYNLVLDSQKVFLMGIGALFNPCYHPPSGYSKCRDTDFCEERKYEKLVCRRCPVWKMTLFVSLHTRIELFPLFCFSSMTAPLRKSLWAHNTCHKCNPGQLSFLMIHLFAN